MDLIKIINSSYDVLYINKRHIIMIEIIDGFMIRLYVKGQQPFSIYRKKNEELEALIKNI